MFLGIDFGDVINKRTGDLIADPEVEMNKKAQITTTENYVANMFNVCIFLDISVKVL